MAIEIELLNIISIPIIISIISGSITASIMIYEYLQRRNSYRRLGRNRTIDEFMQPEVVSKPKLPLLGSSKKIKTMIFGLLSTLGISLVLSILMIDSDIIVNLFSNPTFYIVLGLICDVIGAVMIILPVLFLVEVKKFQNSIDEESEEDLEQRKEIDDFDKLNQKLARIGIVILSSGFTLQIIGNLM